MADVCERCSGRGVIWNGEKEVPCRGRAHKVERVEPPPLSEATWQAVQERWRGLR